jgi:hypothetical protein
MITAKKARRLANSELLGDLQESLTEISSLVFNNPAMGELDISKYYQPLDDRHQRCMVNYLQSLGYGVINQAGWNTILKW